MYDISPLSLVPNTSPNICNMINKQIKWFYCFWAWFTPDANLQSTLFISLGIVFLYNLTKMPSVGPQKVFSRLRHDRCTGRHVSPMILLDEENKIHEEHACKLNFIHLLIDFVQLEQLPVLKLQLPAIICDFRSVSFLVLKSQLKIKKSFPVKLICKIHT
jgi:hypothetical protein